MGPGVSARIPPSASSVSSGFGSLGCMGRDAAAFFVPRLPPPPRPVFRRFRFAFADCVFMGWIPVDWFPLRGVRQPAARPVCRILYEIHVGDPAESDVGKIP